MKFLGSKAHFEDYTEAAEPTNYRQFRQVYRKSKVFEVAEFVSEIISTVTPTNTDPQGIRTRNFGNIQYCSKYVTNRVYRVAEFDFEVLSTVTPTINGYRRQGYKNFEIIQQAALSIILVIRFLQSFNSSLKLFLMSQYPWTIIDEDFRRRTYKNQCNDYRLPIIDIIEAIYM